MLVEAERSLISGHLATGPRVSGESVTFLGDAMTSVVHAVNTVAKHTGTRPVVVGGLAVMCRVGQPHRATVDLDIVDRRTRDEVPMLEILMAVPRATAIEPSSVELPTPAETVKVDVLKVNQAEIDHPSDDVGDRLHASSHAWAHDSATPVRIEVVRSSASPSYRPSHSLPSPGPSSP